MGLQWATALGAAAVVGGFTAQNVTIVYWLQSDVSSYAVLLLCGVTFAVFFTAAAGAFAARTGDWSVFTPSDEPREAERLLRVRAVAAARANAAAVRRARVARPVEARLAQPILEHAVRLGAVRRGEAQQRAALGAAARIAQGRARHVRAHAAQKVPAREAPDAAERRRRRVEQRAAAARQLREPRARDCGRHHARHARGVVRGGLVVAAAP